MADGDRKFGPHSAQGELEGTGSAITVECGFKPSCVELINVDGEVRAIHFNSMAADSAYKLLGISGGTIGAGTAHSHTAGTLANATSAVTAQYDVDVAAVTKPTIALTHNADPVANLAAAALYAIEASGNSITNQIFLESTTDGNASIWGETANGVAGVAASCRFWVTDSDTPSGVQIYVNESSSDQLEFVSPTGADGYIIMPFEAAAGGLPGAAIAVTVHHNASAADGKALYFDDNGAADAQLAFNDAGTTGGTIPAADVAIILPSYIADAAASAGQAAAQTISGSTATEAAHTHTYTGGSGETAFITSDGITLGNNGFIIGADSDINVSAETINWIAFR